MTADNTYVEKRVIKGGDVGQLKICGTLDVEDDQKSRQLGLLEFWKYGKK